MGGHRRRRHPTFRIIFSLPQGHTAADDWQAQITTQIGVTDIEYSFHEPRPDIPELKGTVTTDSDTAVLSIQIRGRFGNKYGTWSPSVLLRCAPVGGI